MSLYVKTSIVAHFGLSLCKLTSILVVNKYIDIYTMMNEVHELMDRIYALICYESGCTVKRK